MKKYFLPDIKQEEVRLVITRFMQQQEICAGDNYYFFDSRLWILSTGIPYGFMGSIEILKESDDPMLYKSALEKDYSRHVVDKDSFAGKALSRIENLLNGEHINILEFIVPECYPPKYVSR